MIIDPYTWHRCAIISVTRISIDTVAIGLERPTGYTYRAGQYAVVRVAAADGMASLRQYSFSSSPNSTQLELLIQHEPEGMVSSWFSLKARVGDAIDISQALGNFTLDKTTIRDKPVLCIAGRIGIAPFISMLREPKHHKKISLLYSVRTESQICFPELLEKYPTTIVRTDISPRIDKRFLKKIIADQPLVYLCGSKQFVDSIASALRELGVPMNSIKRELFTLQ